MSFKMCTHYNDVIMTTIGSQITSLTVVYSTVYSDEDQRKHQSSASLAFVWGIHRDRWIPRTKGQLRGKCFHLMTSWWTVDVLSRCRCINPKTAANVHVRNQHRSYWCLAATAPRPHYSRCWLNIYCTGPILCRHIASIVKNIKRWNPIWKEIRSCLRVK